METQYHNYCYALIGIMILLITCILIVVIIRQHLISCKVDELWLDKLYGPEEDSDDIENGGITMEEITGTTVETINWKQKLSSRKLWLGLIIVIVGVIICVCGDVDNGMKLIQIGGISYLGAEALVDISRIIFKKDDTVGVMPGIEIIENETEPTEEEGTA